MCFEKSAKLFEQHRLNPERRRLLAVMLYIANPHYASFLPIFRNTFPPSDKREHSATAIIKNAS